MPILLSTNHTYYYLISLFYSPIALWDCSHVAPNPPDHIIRTFAPSVAFASDLDQKNRDDTAVRILAASVSLPNTRELVGFADPVAKGLVDFSESSTG